MSQINLLQATTAPGVYSPCGTYRYVLHRRWGTGDTVCFVMLNPSTADDERDDPTVRRCIGYAQAWGYGALVVLNLFAVRSTDPRGLLEVRDPVGPANDWWIAREAKAGAVVCAWGAGAAAPRLIHPRARQVCELLTDAGVALKAIATTKAGWPRHPLYLRKDLTPRPWTAPRTEDDDDDER